MRPNTAPSGVETEDDPIDSTDTDHAAEDAEVTKYHLRGNDYRCASLINSKTFSVRKKYRNKICRTYLILKT